MKRFKNAKVPLWLRMAAFFLFLAAAVLLLFQQTLRFSLERQFQSYILEREETLNLQILEAVKEYYNETGGWGGINMILRHAALSTNVRLVLLDPDRQFMVDTDFPGYQGPPPETLDFTGAYFYHFYLEDRGLVSGELFIAHPVEVEQGAWQEQDLLFRRAVTSSLIWTGLLAISAALILSILFSRRLSQPLEEMARAARRIARGDYRQQLPLYSSRELNELSDNFNHMARHLSELENLRRRSTADISHELRTPLTTLRSYIEAVKDGVMEPDEETMGVVLEEILHLGRVVSDLDELARAEGKRGREMQMERISLNKFVKDKVASFQPLCREIEQQLSLVVPEQEIFLQQDSTALSKILGNLLSNAHRYTDSGGAINVELSPEPEIDPEAVLPLGEEIPEGIVHLQKVVKDMVLIKISDTGSGIPRGQLPYIFERFFRADPSRERSRGGTGIGLALVKELVRASGSIIMVNSLPGVGTTFYLYLPQR